MLFSSVENKFCGKIIGQYSFFSCNVPVKNLVVTLAHGSHAFQNLMPQQNVA